MLTEERNNQGNLIWERGQTAPARCFDNGRRVKTTCELLSRLRGGRHNLLLSGETPAQGHLLPLLTNPGYCPFSRGEGAENPQEDWAVP